MVRFPVLPFSRFPVFSAHGLAECSVACPWDQVEQVNALDKTFSNCIRVSGNKLSDPYGGSVPSTVGLLDGNEGTGVVLAEFSTSNRTVVDYEFLLLTTCTSAKSGFCVWYGYFGDPNVVKSDPRYLSMSLKMSSSLPSTEAPLTPSRAFVVVYRRGVDQRTPPILKGVWTVTGSTDGTGPVRQYAEGLLTNWNEQWPIEPSSVH